MPTHHLVYIEDATLLRMSGDPKFTTPFPWLLEVKQAEGQAAAPSCGTCSRRRAAASGAEAFAKAKLAIAQLPDGQKILLKQLLDTQQVRVIYRRQTDGAMIKLTF